VIVGAHESPVATTTPFDAFWSLTAILSAVVDDDVGGVVVAANAVIK